MLSNRQVEDSLLVALLHSKIRLLKTIFFNVHVVFFLRITLSLVLSLNDILMPIIIAMNNQKLMIGGMNNIIK